MLGAWLFRQRRVAAVARTRRGSAIELCQRRVDRAINLPNRQAPALARQQPSERQRLGDGSKGRDNDLNLNHAGRMARAAAVASRSRFREEQFHARQVVRATSVESKSPKALVGPASCGPSRRRGVLGCGRNITSRRRETYGVS
jgi:hypothetical protein